MLAKQNRHVQNNEIGPLSHTGGENKLKNGLKTQIRPQTLKLLEGNLGSKPFDIGLSNVLGVSSQARETKK